MSQGYFYAMTIIFMLLGIIYQVVIGVCYQRMIQATDGISGTNNKLLRQCRERYVQCYKRNGGMSNTGVFVDKYVNRIKFMGMTMHFLKNLSVQLVLAGVFIAGFGIFRGMVEKKHLVDLLPFYIISLFGIYLFLSITSIVDMNGRKQILKTNLIDYLENDVLRGLEKNAIEETEETVKEKKQRESIFGKRSKVNQTLVAEKEEEKKHIEEEKKEIKPDDSVKLTSEDAKTLEEILRSLLV